MGKGSPPAPKAPEQQTITQTDLPAYVQPQFERLFASAEAESPYACRAHITSSSVVSRTSSCELSAARYQILVR